MARLPSHESILARVASHRQHWGPSPPPGVIPDPVGPGQESVWDYPRPPIVQPVQARIRVVHRGVTIAESTSARRMLETAGAPVYYMPPADVRLELLRETAHLSVCEWKGVAVYHDLVVGDHVVPQAAFEYPDPLHDLDPEYTTITGYFGFYAGRVDEAWVGDERARPQPGGLYAGWLTDAIVGPVKGGPGTGHW
ncbi:MAG: DUF427 domain-containing protein [Myxococcales bacterium]|nr:DUF427 domain-containing protein [Myxococcales bacterium]